MLRLILKIAPLGARLGRASGTRHRLAGENSPSGLPLVAIPYHQMRHKGNIIYSPVGGPPEGLHGTLGHDCIADRGFRRRFRRPVIIHVAAFRLLLRATVTEPNFMLILADLDNLELVIAAGIEQPALPDAGTRRPLLLVAFALAVVNLGNVAETFDPLGQLDERAKGCDARYFSAHEVPNLVLLKPRGPYVVDLLDAE